jgi:hypothetical protein
MGTAGAHMERSWAGSEARGTPPVFRIVFHQADTLQKMQRLSGLTKEHIPAPGHTRRFERYVSAAVFQNAIYKDAINAIYKDAIDEMLVVDLDALILDRQAAEKLHIGGGAPE